MKNFFAVCLMASMGVGSVSAQLTMPQNKLSIQADLALRPGTDYHITKDGTTVEQGHTDAFTKAGFRVSVPFYTKGTTLFMASVRYTHVHQRFNPNMRTINYGFIHSAHHLFAGNVTGMSRLQLWGKPLMLVGIASADFSQYGYERWTMMGTAMLMLKQTRETQFGVGLVGLVNTFSKIPVFPMLTYRHMFNPQWTLNLVVPKFQVEYTPTKSDTFTFGASIDTDHYYIRPQSEGLPNHVRYTRSNINVGPGYAHKFPSHFTLTAEAGAQFVMTNRVYKKGSNHVLATMHEKNTPYCRITLQKGF
jgi:hypothetical protein